MVREMLTVTLLAGLGVLPMTGRDVPPSCGPAPDPVRHAGGHGIEADSSMLTLFASGRTFAEFLDAVTQRQGEWYASTERVAIADTSLRRARAVGGQWHLLVVAVDTCGDSIRQVPYVARLAELVHGMSMRIVTPTEGGVAVQSRYRSLDGRRATPTYVLLDNSGNARGCVVELPRPLRHWLHERRAVGNRETVRALGDSALAWYSADGGASIVAEIVQLMERAQAGAVECELGAVGTGAPL
jgi:hypothetical protein